VAYIELNEEERADFFMQYFNDPDADEEFEGFDEFDIVYIVPVINLYFCTSINYKIFFTIIVLFLLLWKGPGGSSINVSSRPVLVVEEARVPGDNH
jgi:hypothetical protein